MTDDAELLRRYAAEKSEAAFAELVRRHIDLVYAVALRRVGGDAHLAQDLAQGVFTDLARKADALARHPALGAWLFRSTRFAAAQAARAEHRRGVREQEAYVMEQITNKDATPDPQWAELRPMLDDAMDALPERDRIAVWLRVCEGRTFAEVGAKLAASEDAVRVRVDRALEKMRGALARRGIVSTTAALTTALAQEAGVMAPASFVASLTGAALASGSAAGGGLAAWLGISTFMSTTKIAGWGAAVAVLCASLAGNAYFLTRPSPAVGGTDRAVLHQPGSAASARKVAPPADAADRSAAAANPTSEFTTLAGVLASGTDFAVVRDQLRAAGASEASIRATLAGLLRQRYREQVSVDRVSRLRRGWWRDQERTWGTENDIQLPFGDMRLMGEMVTKPLEQLLGVDPLDTAADDRRYAFLPLAVRQELGRLDRSVIGGWNPTGQPEVDARIEAEVKQNNATVAARREELVASLTPEQRIDYDMNFGTFARDLKSQLAQVGSTDQEFRAAFPIADAYAKELAALNQAGSLPTAKGDLDRRTVEQLVATFGFDRALDYIWAGSAEYPAYARVARDANLAPTTAGRVVQLAAETSDRAGAIHADAALTLEQKRSALLALQKEVRPQLDALLPTDAQQRLAPLARAWIEGLSDGQYKTIPTVLPGQVRTIPSSPTFSVEGPLPPAARAFTPRPAPTAPKEK